MKYYFVTNLRRAQKSLRLAFVGGAEQVQVDYTGFAETNGTVTAVTVSVEYGDAAISAESLTSNVKSFLVTTANAGKSLLKLTATSGTDLDVRWIEVWAKDPALAFTDDYGMAA